MPNSEKWMCAGRQALGWLRHGIRAGLDRDEPYRPSRVGDRAAGAREVRVERRRVLIDRVRVAAGRVRLPDLDERLRHGPAVLVEHAPFDDDPLAQRLAGMLAREVVVARSRSRPYGYTGPVSSDSVCGMMTSGSFGWRSVGAAIAGRVVRRMNAFRRAGDMSAYGQGVS